MTDDTRDGTTSPEGTREEDDGAKPDEQSSGDPPGRERHDDGATDPEVSRGSPAETDTRASGTHEKPRVGSLADSAHRTQGDPTVSVTIEGSYDSVLQRLEQPQSFQHGKLDAIAANIQSTLLAVMRTGGGIRSEIYEAVDFELEEPWEIRIYLEVLEMHNLVRYQNDQWVPMEAADRE